MRFNERFFDILQFYVYFVKITSVMSTPEAERFMFDTMAGSLIIGEAAYAESIEAGTHPYDIVDVSAILTGEAETQVEVEPLEVEDWQPKDYIAYGKWLLSVLPDNYRLKHKTLQLAYKHGFGPEPQRIYRKDKRTSQPRFNGYADFYMQIGATESVKKGLHDHMTFTDAMDYVKKECQKIAQRGVRPTAEYFLQLASEGKGPAQKAIKRITGKPYGKLIDMAGYPEPRAWSNEDYVEWGVRFTIANDRLPYHGGIRQLSKRFRGPSDASIARRFGGILSYQTEVEAAYRRHVEEKEYILQAKLDDIKLGIEDGTIPSTILDETDQEKLLITAGKLAIVHKVLDGITPKQALTIARIKSTDAFVNGLLKRAPKLTKADIEVVALGLGVFDDLWPCDDYKEYLKIVPESL